MKPHDDDLTPGLRRVGEQLHDAARREVHTTRPRRRVPQRAVATALVGVLVLGAGAGAATIMGTGPFVRDHPGMPRQLKPANPGIARLVVTVPDAGAGGRWGVRVYTSRSGNDCAVAGWARGSRVGIVARDRFRPYAPDVTGACGDLSNSRFFLSLLTVTRPALRTLVYGRAQRSVGRLELTDARSIRFAAAGPRGAFLFVLAGRRTLDEFQLRALDRSDEPRRP